MNVVIGTAGHIDHGKTALVRSLTGIDTDRLPEEKKRGITIDLGFAELKLGELDVAFIDVPGHERFVRNMLAGAFGIDLVMLVVAGDEGVMPQTREHFEICRLLGVRQGLIAVTKTDLADPETIGAARAEIEELVKDSFLQGAPVFEVSARLGDGVEELRSGIEQAAFAAKGRNSSGIARLSIDRSFAAKGFGTVVTGTLLSGRVNAGDELELLPEKIKVKVRGIQVHGHSEPSASAGMRTALNLSGVSHSEVSRGMVLSERGVLIPTSIFDARVELLNGCGLRSRQRVRVHIGTQEVMARVQILDDPGEIENGKTGLVQFRLEAPAVTISGDRFIIRKYSPQDTIGGGIVVDPFAVRHRRSEFTASKRSLEQIEVSVGSETEILAAFITGAKGRGLTIADLRSRTGHTDETLRPALDSLVNDGSIMRAGNRYIPSQEFKAIASEILERVAAHHRAEPLSKGLSRETVRAIRLGAADIAEAAIELLVSEKKIAVVGDVVSIYGAGPRMTGSETKAAEVMCDTLRKAGLQVPSETELFENAREASGLTPSQISSVLRVLIDSGDVKRISPDLVFSSNAIEKLIEELKEFAIDPKNTSAIDVAGFKTLAGVSRKYAIPLLEYFDREKVTVRVGEKRIIR